MSGFGHVILCNFLLDSVPSFHPSVKSLAEASVLTYISLIMKIFE